MALGLWTTILDPIASTPKAPALAVVTSVRRKCHRWYHTFVDKTTVYLPIELKTALRRVALQRGVSEAEVIRESIRQAVMGVDRPRPSGGLYAGKAPIARAADRHLRGFGER